MVAFGGPTVLMILVGSAVHVDNSLKADTDKDADPGERLSV